VHTKATFELTLDALRALGSWAADCAERALPIYEEIHPDDSRPRAALEAIRTFAAGGKRTQQLRVAALAAFAAARETPSVVLNAPAATAAARAAGLAASSAYTHPLRDVQQTKHIVGPAAYAALALEIAHDHDLESGHQTIQWALEHVNAEIAGILNAMPNRSAGKSRIDQLMAELDRGIRSKYPG